MLTQIITKNSNTALNNVTDIFNIDISKNVKGRLYFNDYYLECNII